MQLRFAVPTFTANLALLLLPVAAIQGNRPTQAYQDFTARITEELQNRNPRAADLFVSANEARDSLDLATAEALYRQVHEIEPGFFHATRRLCGVVLQRGRRKEALSLCREAYAAAETRENRSALVGVLVSGEGGQAPTYEEAQEALVHARVLLEDPESEEYGVMNACFAFAVNEMTDLLRECSARLDRVSENRELRHYVAWMADMLAGDYDAAEMRLHRALADGMSPDVYSDLLDTTRDARPVMPRLARTAGLVGGVWLAGLALLLTAGAVLSRLTIRSVRRLPTVPSGESVGLDAALRKIYRAVLWLCCAYYYVSLPIVLLVVVGAGAAVLYAFLAAGRIPIRLVIIIVALVLVTLWAVLKSILVRSRGEEPGELLHTSDHPKLRNVLDEVAGEIGTRPVDNVYLTPGTDLAVTERGGMLRQLRGSPERCLILGLGVLEGMKLGPFKAVLAHEYGHFSNRDTAGGGFALAVRRSLLTMARALAEGGAATWYSPAWLFLNSFYRVFLRISQGASRLQEVLADRWAAFAFGAKQFGIGLLHVIERSVRFDAHAQLTLNEVIDKKHALVNLYSYQPLGMPEEQEFRKAVESAINAEPSPYDSHPSPRDRIGWVNQLDAAPTGDLSDSEEDAWDLFSNRGELELWMTDVVRNNVAASHGITIGGARVT